MKSLLAISALLALFCSTALAHVVSATEANGDAVVITDTGCTGDMSYAPSAGGTITITPEYGGRNVGAGGSAGHVHCDDGREAPYHPSGGASSAGGQARRRWLLRHVVLTIAEAEAIALISRAEAHWTVAWHVVALLLGALLSLIFVRRLARPASIVSVCLLMAALASTSACTRPATYGNIAITGGTGSTDLAVAAHYYMAAELVGDNAGPNTGATLEARCPPNAPVYDLDHDCCHTKDGECITVDAAHADDDSARVDICGTTFTTSFGCDLYVTTKKGSAQHGVRTFACKQTWIATKLGCVIKRRPIKKETSMGSGPISILTGEGDASHVTSNVRIVGGIGSASKITCPFCGHSGSFTGNDHQATCGFCGKTFPFQRPTQHEK